MLSSYLTGPRISIPVFVFACAPFVRANPACPGAVEELAFAEGRTVRSVMQSLQTEMAAADAILDAALFGRPYDFTEAAASASRALPEARAGAQFALTLLRPTRAAHGPPGAEGDVLREAYALRYEAQMLQYADLLAAYRDEFLRQDATPPSLRSFVALKDLRRRLHALADAGHADRPRASASANRAP